jgi:2-C-methyl-D-erythritol 2,4-cyclodiphosphate synthase
MPYKIGIGYDIHRLVEGRRLFLGGLEIPYARGLLGHSDADVLLHAIMDALLGALALGDIGEHFPDSDPRYRGIASLELLKQVLGLVEDRRYRLSHIDSVVIAEEPKLLPFKEGIRQNIADILGLERSSVSLKAKTNEGCGEIGRGQAIACYAVVLLDDAA